MTGQRISNRRFALRIVLVFAGHIGLAVWSAAAQEALLVSQTLTGPGILGTTGQYYYPDGTVDVWVEVSQDAPADVASLRFEAVLPDGWTYLGVGGTDFPQITPLNTTGTLVFRWLGARIPPVTFWYRLLAPGGDIGPQTISGAAYGRVGELSVASDAFMSVVDLDREAPVLTLSGAAAMTLDCGAFFVDPGVSALDNADGNITSRVIRGGDWVYTSTPGRYTLTYNVTDTSGNAAIPITRTVIVLENGPGDYCQDECATDPGTDTDGDGLTNCQERCQYGTNPESPDTDNDGMGDAYEVQYLPQLNPNDAADRNADPDGDSLTNLEEFLRGSSPIDPADPERTYYVAPPPQGVDDEALGSIDHPWATIGFALEHALASTEFPATIILLGGIYEEDAVLRSHITLKGAPGSTPIILGQLTGADDSVLSNVEVRALQPSDALLNLMGEEPEFNGIAMRVSGVTFRGGAAGILMGGARSGGATVTDCTFTGMNLGIDIRGPLPVLRRCVFDHLVSAEKSFAAGVYIRAAARKQGGGSLGDATDPSAGWNTFDTESIAGYAVFNERTEEIKMEENDWGTDDPAEVAAAIGGAADFEPFLAKGSGILAAAIACTVWDAETLERVVNGSVRIVPSAYSEVTLNSNGVYTFPAIGSGTYTLNVSAPDFVSTTKVVLLADGELASVIVPLSKTETPPQGCCRNENPAKLSGSAGDLLLGVLSLFALLGLNSRFASTHAA